MAAPDVESASEECGKGQSSITPSLRISIHRTRPEERGKRESGIVIMAVMRDVGELARPLSEWRNGSTFSGSLTSGGYNVGLRNDGMTIR